MGKIKSIITNVTDFIRYKIKEKFKPKIDNQRYNMPN